MTNIAMTDGVCAVPRIVAGHDACVVGVGGTLRPGSSTERLLKSCLASVERRGGRTQMFSGEDLELPMYDPRMSTRTAKATRLLDALRRADAVVVASPGYHGGVSGMVKNALDYVEDLRDEPRTYLDGRPWGCIAGANGWQAAVATLNQLRGIGHALRAWPTPLGVAVNSAEPIWNEHGMVTDQSIAGQIDLLADQVLTFASRTTPAGLSHPRD